MSGTFVCAKPVLVAASGRIPFWSVDRWTYRTLGVYLYACHLPKSRLMGHSFGEECSRRNRVDVCVVGSLGF